MLDKKECKTLLKIAKGFIKLNTFIEGNDLSQPSISKFMNSENDNFISKEKVNNLCDEIYNACCLYCECYEDSFKRTDDGVKTKNQEKTERKTADSLKLLGERKQIENNENSVFKDKEQQKYLDDLLVNEIFGMIAEYGKNDAYSFRDMMEILLRSYALGKKRGLGSK